MEKIFKKNKTTKKEEKTFKKKYHFLSWHLFSVEEFKKKKQPKFFRENTDTSDIHGSMLHFSSYLKSKKSKSD